MSVSGGRMMLGERALTVEDVVAAGRGGMHIDVVPALRSRMQRARDVLDAHLAAGTPVYGLNTGLGGNIGHRVTAGEAAGWQRDLVLARLAGVGEPLPAATGRMVLFCRLAGLAQAGAGVSLPVFDLMAAMLARDVIPVLPSRGSIGASDLVMTMGLAAAVIGEGEVWFGGQRMPASEGLAAAGLSPVLLAPKDGLSVGSASAVTLAMAAAAVAAVDELMTVHVATAALACQGFGASPRLFDAGIAAARPSGLQMEAAALFRAALEGSDYATREPRKVQDAISFRALPQITGTVLAALAHARRETEIELNAAADNPLVLPDDDAVHSSANFLTSSLALAFDALAIAAAQLSAASMQRSIKLMTGRLSGLPNYLSPVGGASAGFVPMQKSLAALHAEVRLKATPASIEAAVVSEMVEDIGSNSLLAVTKLAEQLEPLRCLVSMEAMVAAQAVDLRCADEPGPRLSPVTRRLYEAVRDTVPALHEDRPTGPDAVRVHEALWNGGLARGSGKLSE